MTTAQLDGIDLATAVPDALVVRVLRPLGGARRNVHVDIPGRAGSHTFAEQPGDRVLTLELDLQAATFEDRRAACTALADWADLGRQARLIIDDEPDRFHLALLDDADDLDEWLTGARNVRVPFRVGPYAHALATSSAEFTAEGGPDSGTFAGAAGALTALPVVEITPTDGDLTAFEWTLNDTTIGFAELVTSGSTVTISSISDTVTRGVNGDTDLTGAFLVGLVAMGSVVGDFGLIVPGVNTWAIEWTGSATEVAISITWRERYR